MAAIAPETERTDSQSSNATSKNPDQIGPRGDSPASGAPSQGPPRTSVQYDVRTDQPNGTPTSGEITSQTGQTQTGTSADASAMRQTQKPSFRQRLAGMFRRNRESAEPTGGRQAPSGQSSSGSASAVPDHKAVEDNRRDASIQQLRRGFNETMETMKSVRTHMEDHSRRSQRMVELLEGLNGLPEASRQQTTVLRDVQKNIETGNRNSGELSKAVENLSQSANKQDQTIGKLEQRLGTHDQVRHSLDNLSSSLTKIDKTQTDAQEAYSRDMKQAQQVVAQSRKTMIMMGLITSVLSAGALGVAVWALIVVLA